MYLLNEYTLQGLSRDSITGNRQLNLSLEINSYTPWYFYGFQFAIIGFIDIGIVGSSSENIFRNKIYSGIGGGFRIRNESLVFETIQLTFSFYPMVPEGSKHMHFDLVSKPRIALPDFQATKPIIIPYQYYYRDIYYN